MTVTIKGPGRKVWERVTTKIGFPGVTGVSVSRRRRLFGSVIPIVVLSFVVPLHVTTSF